MTKGELSLYEKRGAAALAAEADRQLAAKKSRVRRPPKRNGDEPTRKEAKAAKDVQRAAETARIRLVVDRRDLVCVICDESAPEPWELHHVDSGTGKSQRQTVRNCCKTHEGCHKRAHRGDIEALGALLRWAQGYDYWETVLVIERRIDKVFEARPPASRSDGDAQETNR